MKKFKLPFVVAIMVTAASMTWAAENTIEQCRAIKLNTKRLQCYDSIPDANTGVGSSISPKGEKRLKVWDLEPDSFLGVKIDKPLKDSYPDECPLTTRYTFEVIDSYQWGKQGKPKCSYVHTQAKQPWAEFLGHGVDGLRKERVSFYGDGLVGRISARFLSIQYKEMLSALIQRFGPPTTSVPTAMKLNNGGELPSAVNTWVGKNSVLTIVELAYRETDGGLIDYGEMSFTAKGYLDQERESENKATQGRSQMF